MDKPFHLKLAGKLRTLRKASPSFLFFFFVAWFVLGYCRLSILLFSFKNLATRLGVQDGVNPRTPLCRPDQEPRIKTIGEAIRAASKYTPWVSNCFPQAIAARYMLGFFNIPYALFFGVQSAASNGALSAHAWVVSGRYKVTGGNGFDGYTTVGCFVAESSLPVKVDVLNNISTLQS